MTIASLIVDVAANTAKLQTDVEQIHTTLDKVTKIAGVVGGALAGAFAIEKIVSYGKQVLDFVGQLTDLSHKTGISTTGLQKLQLAFEQSGVSLDTVTRSVGELGARLVGDKGAQKLVEQLGLNLAELKKMSPEEQFMKVADAVGNIQNKGEQLYASKTLFGKGGIEMLQALDGHLEETTKGFEDMGLIIDEQTIKAADDFGDQLGLIGKQMLGILANAIGPMLPALSALAHAFAAVATVLGEVLGVAVKVVMVALTGLYSAIADTLGYLADMAQKIPMVGKHLGFLADASEFLHDSARQSAEMMAKLAFNSTGAGEAAAGAGQAAHAAAPHLLGLGAAAETSGHQVDFLKTQLGQMALSGVQVQMAFDSINKSMAEQGVHLPKLAVMHKDLESSTDALSKSSENYLKIHTLTQYEILKSIHATEQYKGAMDSLVDGFQSGLDNLWKGMSGGKGFAGLMHNLGDSIVGGFGNIISGGLTSVINMGVQLAVEGVKKIGSLIAGLFKSEESAKVNKPRDKFFAQFGGFDGLATELTNTLIGQGVIDAGNVAGGLIRTLNDADTEAKFHAAELAIADVFKGSGRDVGIFAGGTDGLFPNFGSGTSVELHNRERIVTEAEGRRESDVLGLVLRALRELPTVITDGLKTAAVYSR